MRRVIGGGVQRISYLTAMRKCIGAMQEGLVFSPHF